MMISSVGNCAMAAGYSSMLSFSQGVSAIYAKWSTSLALASLGNLAWESSGVSPYSLNPAAASMMDSLQNDLAIETQSLIGAGYAEAKAQQVDSSLAQVNDLLTTVQVDILSMADGTLTDSQKAAKQMEIDSALKTIDLVDNMTSITGQKLLDGKPITYNATTNPQNEISFTPPKVSTGSLGNDTGKLSDLSALLSEGKYDEAMKITQDAQSTIRNGRAAGGNFSRAVEIQKDIVLDQMENTVSLYNQAAEIVYGSPSKNSSSFMSAILNLNRFNVQSLLYQSLIGGINRW